MMTAESNTPSQPASCSAISAASPSSPSQWELQAPAKINLTLRVLGKRPDGYHALETLMVRVSLFDTLQFEVTQDAGVALRLEYDYPPGLPLPTMPPAEGNLVSKAARLLQQETGCQRGAVVRLTKRIPTEAGLGGGSSDAAAALRGLNRLWQLGMSSTDLQVLSAQLGSDVPFFLAESPWVLCTGRGEQLQPLVLPVGMPIVLARPQGGLSTAEVYRHCQPGCSASTVSTLRDAALRRDWTAVAQALQNDLQAPALRLSPEVARLRSEFDRLGLLGHQLTGSGSAYFGIAETASQAELVASELRKQGVPWACAAVTTDG
jgi:4-diphosphocytidyl-2-C-methyl-D-erythritol kinase